MIDNWGTPDQHYFNRLTQIFYHHGHLSVLQLHQVHSVSLLEYQTEHILPNGEVLDERSDTETQVEL